MVRENITVLCYWNGRTTLNSRRITYEGAAPKPVKVSSRISYNNLVDKMYGVTGFDRVNNLIKITCSYPSNSQEYIALPVEDDDTMSIVLDVLKGPDTNCLEFCLESTPLQVIETTNVQEVISNGPFTQLLTQDDGFLDLNIDIDGCSFTHQQFAYCEVEGQIMLLSKMANIRFSLLTCYGCLPEL
ncbi:hypothetical protein OROMI_022255 [Orobanche minor]